MTGPARPDPALNILAEELDEAAALCRGEGLGAEVTAFAFADALDDPGFPDTVARHRDALRGVAPLSFHGPFLDLYVTSPDPRIVQVCQERHERALGAAIELGVDVYVAHLNAIPLIRNRRYLDRFAKRAAAFWRPLADRAAEAGITIALENMWEPTPETQRRVIEEADHPALRASFDNGHALVFSDLPAPAWIDTLAPVLAHCHLHDNHGHYDAHDPLGTGAEDWLALLAALDAVKPRPLVVLESDDLARNRESLRAWRRLRRGAPPAR